MYYRSLNAYLRETFGCKVYKLALSAGCTCPNRDGMIGTRGCIFCSGSGEFTASASLSIPEQLAQAKRLVAAKAGPDARYIAYFQDFTNTYAPAEVLGARGGGPGPRTPPPPPKRRWLFSAAATSPPC